MVRVIDPNPQGDVEKTISCTGCGAKIAYVPNDVKKYSGTDYGGGPDGREWVVCPIPTCNHETTIKSW